MKNLPTNRNQSGMTLLITTVMLTLALIGGMSMLSTMQGGTVIAGNNLKSLEAQYLAQAGLEYGMQRMSSDLLIAKAMDTNAITIDTSLNYANAILHVNIQKPKTAKGLSKIPAGPYAGLYGRVNPYFLLSQAELSGKYGAQAESKMEYWNIPLFQFGIILQNTPDVPANVLGGSTDTQFDGPIHSNGDLGIESGMNCSFQFKDRITVAGDFYCARADYNALKSVTLTNGSSDVSIYTQAPYLRYSSEITPNWTETAMSRWNGRLQDQSHGVEAIKLPMLNKEKTIEMIYPKKVTDTESEKAFKLVYQCDKIIKVNFSSDGGTYTMSVQNNEGFPISMDASIFSTDLFFSMWELDDIAWLVIDVAKMGALSEYPANGALYVETSIDNPNKQAGVMLINGYNLTAPLSIISNHFIAVKGNYNNGDSVGLYSSGVSTYVPKPAGLMASSIYYLSRNFNSADNQASNFFTLPADDITPYTNWTISGAGEWKNMRRWNKFKGSGAGFGPGGQYILEIRASTFTSLSLGSRVQESLARDSRFGNNRYIIRRVGSQVPIMVDKTDPQYPNNLYARVVTKQPGYDGDNSPGYHPPEYEFVFDQALRTADGLPPATPVAAYLHRPIWLDQARYASY